MRRTGILTVRQRQVLQLRALGVSSSEICRTLYMTDNSLKTLNKRVFARLSVSDMAAAVAAGMRAGIII